MFALESEMANAAIDWLKASGMAVKSEFATPWGVCDLVGVKFNQKHVEHRLKLKQTKAVGSITRAILLLQIPDIETRRSVAVGQLVRKFSPAIPEEVVQAETDRLVADRFVVFTTTGRLQKVNGWMPLHDRLIAVELKLSRIKEAMHQAANNLGFAGESYVGLPTDVAQRVARNPSRWAGFFDTGVGLLGVSEHGCKVLVKSRSATRWTDFAIQLHCVEKFWRREIETMRTKYTLRVNGKQTNFIRRASESLNDALSRGAAKLGFRGGAFTGPNFSVNHQVTVCDPDVGAGRQSYTGTCYEC